MSQYGSDKIYPSFRTDLQRLNQVHRLLIIHYSVKTVHNSEVNNWRTLFDAYYSHNGYYLGIDYYSAGKVHSTEQGCALWKTYDNLDSTKQILIF